MFRRGLLMVAMLVATGTYAQTGATQVGAIRILPGPKAAHGTAIRAGLELMLEVDARGVLGRQIALTVDNSRLF